MFGFFSWVFISKGVPWDVGLDVEGFEKNDEVVLGCIIILWQYMLHTPK